ncbi:hypothetical protein ACH5RR_018886 [Cinchona calisaya]|uniref:Serpin domain-containing protein n=1 Tax=Cinchona calisaya TaxID=153742 RepID=A0ABD2ZMT2_9GENT
MVAAGCSQRTLEHVLSYIGCRDLNDLKSMVSMMMNITISSSSSSNTTTSRPGSGYYQGSGGPTRHHGGYYQGSSRAGGGYYQDTSGYDRGYHQRSYGPGGNYYQGNSSSGGGYYQSRGTGRLDRRIRGNRSGPKISFANGVWVDKRFSLKPSYQNCVAHVFKSQAKIVDFMLRPEEAVSEINSWAESHTNGLIKDVIDRRHILPDTRIILGNALYFKGSWEKKFNPKCTTKRDFYLLNGAKIKVPFMTSSESYLYGSFGDFKVLEIPYQRSMQEDHKRFSMQFILPNKIDGLQNLLDKFKNNNPINSVFSSHHNFQFQLSITDLTEFWIPKFKFSCSFEKIKFPFMQEGCPMELTEMLQQNLGDLALSNIIHKALIEVDEEGTEAAAVTLAIGFGCAPNFQKPEIKTFVADHPFLFIIKEDISGLILFTGAVLNPLSE